MKANKSILIAASAVLSLTATSAFAGDIETLLPNQSAASSLSRTVVQAGAKSVLDIDTLVARELTKSTAMRAEMGAKPIQKAMGFAAFSPVNL